MSRPRVLISTSTALLALGLLGVLPQTAGAVEPSAYAARAVHRSAAVPRRAANSSCRQKPAAKRQSKVSGKCLTPKRHTTTHTQRPATTSSSTSAAAKSASEAAASHAATIAGVLATPCQNTQLTPEPSNLPLVRAAVLCLINTERAQNGLEPLQTNAHLEAAAQSHGREMLALNYFAHVSPSGETPVERVRENGYIPSSEDGYVIGENLAWGTLSLATPESIVKAWIASPEHLANILESKYRDTGIDVEPEVPNSLAEGVQGALYTQEFGVIIE